MQRAWIIMLVLGLFTLAFIGEAESQSKVEDNQVGTYALFKINKNGEELLYRINTRTGQVWLYSENNVATSMNLTGKEKETLDNFIESAKKENKVVFTNPHWALTSEKEGDYYFMKQMQ